MFKIGSTDFWWLVWLVDFKIRSMLFFSLFIHILLLFRFGILKISIVLVQSRERFKHQSLIWFVGGRKYIPLHTFHTNIEPVVSANANGLIFFYKLAHKSILFCNTRNIGIDWWCMFHLIHEIQPIKMGHTLVNTVYWKLICKYIFVVHENNILVI